MYIHTYVGTYKHVRRPRHDFAHVFIDLKSNATISQPSSHPLYVCMYVFLSSSSALNPSGEDGSALSSTQRDMYIHEK